MNDYKKQRKLIAFTVIIAFVFQFQSELLIPQEPGGDLERHFNKARNYYIVPDYVNARKWVERAINVTSGSSLSSSQKDILGKCYLLLGAVDEIEGKEDAAKGNYHAAIVEYDIEKIDGIDLTHLPIYNRSLKEGRFEKARRYYLRDQLTRAKEILEILKKELEPLKNEDRKLLGKVYLLLGAVFERQGVSESAKENYQRAIVEYNAEEIEPIEGIDFTLSPIYQRSLKEEKFERAKINYIQDKPGSAKEILVKLERELDPREEEDKELQGKVKILLGAVLEKEKKYEFAGDCFVKAIVDYDVEKIEGIDLAHLQTYNRSLVEGRLKRYYLQEKEKGDKNKFESAVKILNDLKQKLDPNTKEGKTFLGKKEDNAFLGKAYLLLGAIFEKEEKIESAIKNYQIAITRYDTDSIEGIDLSGLPYYQFEKAIGYYFKNKLETAKEILEKLDRELGTISNKELMGKVNLLLGAVFEKEDKTESAKKHYRIAIVNYDTESIEGVDLAFFPVYKRSLREERFEQAKWYYSEGKKKGNGDEFESAKRILLRLEGELDAVKKENKEFLGKVYVLLGAANEKLFELEVTQTQKISLKYDFKEYYKKAKKLLPPKARKVSSIDVRVIVKEKEGCNPIEGIDLSDLEYFKKYYCKKKKFPILLVVGGAVGVTVAIILLTKKKKRKEYTLTVNLGGGIEGTPQTGTSTHKEGTILNYNYTLKSGYNNLVVQVDGNNAPDSGTITMNQNHTLTASASTNVVNFVTDSETIEVPENSTAAFNVKLSAQPTGDVNVTVARESGDTDIRVISGSNLTFTTDNWDTFQPVTLQADDDADVENGQAVISISAPGITQKNIIATEQDDDEEEVVTVRIVQPGNGTEVTRGITLDIEANASGTYGIEKIEFYVGNRLIDVDSMSPYQTKWDTTPELHGSYDIKAIAYGKKGTKAQAKVTVIVLPQ